MRPALARLNPGGDLDYSFNARLNGQVTALALQPDGKLLVGGKFQNSGGATRKGITRVNPDGSLDSTFDIGSGFYSAVQVLVSAIVLQADGKVLVGGGFTSFNGVRRNAILRLHSDGTLDQSFDCGTGPDGIVYAMALQPDGNLIIAGDFNNVNGTPRDRLARLYGDNPPPRPPRISLLSPGADYDEVSFLSEPRRTFTLECSHDLSSSNWLSRLSTVGDGSQMSLRTTNPPASQQFYRLRVE